MTNRSEEHARDVANRMIEALQAGTAPLQRQWKAGVALPPGEGMPRNAISGKGYRGGNAISLMIEQSLKGYTSDEWVTYQQALSLGGQVRKGERGSTIAFWKFPNQSEGREGPEPVSDLDPSKRPTAFYAKVFNANQIDNMPPAKERVMPTVEWRHEEAERVLRDSGAVIKYGGDEAYYSPSADVIQLPARAAFPSADNFFAVGLHELGHWSGGKGRLGRDLSGRFGSEAYAREELRAELASLMMGERLSIGHDPGQHAAYVASWIKILRDDPKEILRASADAEKICTFLGVEHYEQKLERKQSQQQTQNVVPIDAAKSERDRNHRPSHTDGADLESRLIAKARSAGEQQREHTRSQSLSL